MKESYYLSTSKEIGETRQILNNNFALLKKYLREYSCYLQLCTEIKYILEKELKKAGIAYSNIIFRIKSFESIEEKIIRKNYKEPLKEITDIAGVRIVYMYISDLEKIIKILNTEFEIIVKDDKTEDKGIDKFGYCATHYLIKIGKKSYGARYNDLKAYTCELQVRTVLQDAWSQISHHLVYKHETEIPDVIKRNLNAMAGSLESADTLFESIRKDRESHLNEFKQMKRKKLLSQKINFDTINTYLEEKFPKSPKSSTLTQIVLERLRPTSYKNISELDFALNKTKKARAAYMTNLIGNETPAQGELLLALAFFDAQNCIEGNPPWDDFPETMVVLIKKYYHLVEK